MSNRSVYFDCVYGICGDMTLGALVDAGADFKKLQDMLSTLPIKGFQLKKRKIKRCGLMATKVDVIVDECKDRPRSLRDIKNIIAKSKLPEKVKSNAIKAYEILGKAESRVHKTSLEDVHFHEVGCIDAIVDIAGAFSALYLLNIDEAYASEITVGSGVVQTLHGEMPIPAPATLEILKRVPIKSGDIIGEQTTPTGAAILKACVKEFLPLPLIKPIAIGYGAGERELAGKSNFLRVIIFESDSKAFLPLLEHQKIFRISTEIDDMNTEFYTEIFSGLFKLNALDVLVIPVIMKKNRPGFSLQVLCDKENLEPILEYLFRNTSTFGVRVEQMERFCLERYFDQVRTRYGLVDVKVGCLGKEKIKVKPEFDSCQKISKALKVSLDKIYQSVAGEVEKKFFK